MNEHQLKKILDSETELDNRLINLKKHISRHEELGHLEKAEHNLHFVSDTDRKYSDWIIVGCYYSLYHTALALLAKKGYSSKDHDATLCLLIKEYRKQLEDEEIMQINETYLDNEDVLFYAEARNKRRAASYSSQVTFQDVSTMMFKTRVLFNKMREILND